MEETLYRAWDHVVEAYMSRSLTVASDKLPALSGVAMEFHDALRQCSRRDNRCIAGIWEGNLPFALAWLGPTDGQRRTWLKANEGYQPERQGRSIPSNQEDIHESILEWGLRIPGAAVRPRKYIAPSWSWASHIGPMEHHRESNNSPFTSRVDIVQIDLQLENSKYPFGRLQSAAITLSGHLVPGLKLASLLLGFKPRDPVEGHSRIEDIFLLYDSDNNNLEIYPDDPFKAFELSNGDEPMALLLLGHRDFDLTRTPHMMNGMQVPKAWLGHEQIETAADLSSIDSLTKEGLAETYMRVPFLLVLRRREDESSSGKSYNYERIACVVHIGEKRVKKVLQTMFAKSQLQTITIV